MQLSDRAEAERKAEEHRVRLNEAVGQISDKLSVVSDPAKKTAGFLQDHPWMVLAGSLLVGLTTGFRKRRRPMLLLPSGSTDAVPVQSKKGPSVFSSLVSTVGSILLKEAATRLAKRLS